MLKRWILYLVVFITCFIFVFLYKDVLALLLFISVVSLPIILFFIHLISFFACKVEIDFESGVVFKPSPIVLKFKVKNRSPFSISRILVKLECENKFLGDFSSCEIPLTATAFKTNSFNCQIESDFIGVYNVKVVKIRIFDLMGLFNFRKKSSFETKFTLLPKAIDFDFKNKNKFSKLKENYSSILPMSKGSENEMIGLRDYKQGDSLSRVHWKLSSKKDELIVREFASFSAKDTFVYIDLSCKEITSKKANEFEILIQCVYSFVLANLKDETSLDLAWFDYKEKKMFCKEITNEQEFLNVVQEMFLEFACNEESSTDFNSFFESLRYLKCFYFTTKKEDNKNLEDFKVVKINLTQQNVVNFDNVGVANKVLDELKIFN